MHDDIDRRTSSRALGVQAQPWTSKRNPRLFNGKYISITRRPDGSLRPNFRPMKVGADFSVEKYAVGVANELLWGLESLIENESVEEKSE